MEPATVQSLNPQGDLVVGVDGSQESFGALRWALRQAALSGQTVNAVYGWSYSWDMGPEPTTDDELAKLRTQIAEKLRDWVKDAAEGIDISSDQIRLTSFRASGASALLEIGSDAQQIVVGRRTLGRVARWFSGSLSSSLAEESQIPVTIIRVENEDQSVQDEIASALTPGSQEVHFELPAPDTPRTSRPIVVGVDGSDTSRRALEFAAWLANLNHAPLHVMYCWQLKDMTGIPGYETSVPPLDVAQQHAEQVVQELIASSTLPEGLPIKTDVFHISAGTGLVSASRYCRHIVVGSRGLAGADAHFLGSVSKQLINLAECNLTIVH